MVLVVEGGQVELVLEVEVEQVLLVRQVVLVRQDNQQV